MTAIAAFQLTAPTTQAAAPFCIGHAFKAGNVPAGQQLVAGFANLQVTPKNVWPDGSLKFAIIAGRVALTASVPLTVQLSTGTPTGGTALTTADLKATGVTAAIGAGTFGTVSWATTDWDAPFMAWVGGPQMSSWVYRKQFGSDAHLVGWMEVRLYAGGAVEILPWIENGYVLVAAPTNKSATYTFTMGGTQRFSAAIDLPNHCRTPLLSGALLSHWLGTDPGVIPSHDPAYQNATRITPAYSAVASEPILAGQVQTFAPLQQGAYATTMGTAGYHPSIGLLPQWDIAYLTTGDARAYRGVVLNGYSAGRFGLHYRDASTFRPIQFSSYPNLVLAGSGDGITGTGASTINQYTPAATGTSPATWSSTHHPSVGFTAYLVTGRFYFMEQVQFAATIHFLKSNDDQRGFTGGVFWTHSGSHTVRGAAWALRTLAQAACATPDADTPLHTEFINSLAANVNYYHAKFIAAVPQPNPYGLVLPYANYTSGQGFLSVSPWMNDFFTAATGYALAMDLPLSSGDRAKLVTFFAWKARTIIGRMGPANNLSAWSYRDAAVYTLPIAPTESPDLLNPASYYPSWQAMYEKSRTGMTPSQNTDPDGNLRGGNFPDASSYWGNAMPAIAYAVEHGVAGAPEAYARVTSAPNFNLLQADLAAAPEWSVVPHNYAPAEVTVTTPGPSSVFDTDSLLGAGSSVFDTHRGLGVPLSEVPTGGAGGTCSLRDMIEVGDNPLSEIRWAITRWPTLGTLVLDGVGGWNYTGAADSFDFEARLDGELLGARTITLAAAGTVSTITGVTISPTTATGAVTFTKTVSGTGSFSSAGTFSKISGGGSINPSTGAFVPPAQTGSIQTIIVRFTSDQDANKWAEATITISAAVVPEPVTIIRAPRFARPESDVSAGGWVPSTGSSLFAMIDELSADSGDFISATSAATAVVALNPVIDPNTSNNQVVRYQAWAPSGGSLTVRLKQGSTVIASWTHSTLPVSPTIFPQTLTAPQCDSITDYTLLRLEFVASP